MNYRDRLIIEQCLESINQLYDNLGSNGTIDVRVSMADFFAAHSEEENSYALRVIDANYPVLCKVLRPVLLEYQLYGKSSFCDEIPTAPSESVVKKNSTWLDKLVAIFRRS